MKKKILLINCVNGMQKMINVFTVIVMVLSLFLSCPIYGSPFSDRIREQGFDKIQHDWSDEAHITFGEPRCAYVNVTGTTQMPEYKGDKLHCWMEVYDGEGNYFRKRVILDAQGNTSLTFPKKNLKVDFCEDEWVGDVTPTITIGAWVSQDGFHLKAYYNDYFRGVAVAGYKLYELMTADVGHAWTRSDGLAKYEPRALCHPDGFPCVVYLNGDFYGIYSWQLKKHRANMAQRKNDARHIHLDGRIANNTFWGGVIDWTAFEIRNPKDVGEETRQCVVSLSKACSDLQRMEIEERGAAELRAEFMRRFDVQSLVDYACLHYLIANYDGFAKNWQWFTYDGVRWFVAPYDLDSTFGNVDTGNVLMPVSRTGLDPYWVLYTEGPMYWLARYFMDDIKKRYCQLRSDGMIGREMVKEFVNDWYWRIGERNYEEEWNRWKDSKCIREPQYAWCWKPVDEWVRYQGLPDWDPTVEYKAGDVCRLDMCEWVATADNKGVKPYVSLGYVDSMERLKEWIDERFSLIDSYLGYVEDVGIGKETIGKCATSIKAGIYDMLGNRNNSLRNGVNIIVGEDGRTRKVLSKHVQH